MPIWRQILLAFVLAVAAVIGWALLLPQAAGPLDRVGLLAPMQRVGLAAPAPEPAPSGRGGSSSGTMVIADPVALGVMNDEATAIGTAQAVRSVILTPEVSGRIAEVHIRSSEHVTAGQLLARIDNEAERLAVERAQLMLEDAEATAARLNRLQGSGATTEVQIREAALAVQTARLNLRQAEFELSRRDLIAPIDGHVGLLTIEPGTQVTSTTEITRIDDRSRLLVEFRLPERLVGQLSPGFPVEAAPLARPGQVLTGTISAVDNRVDQATRSLRVQAEIDNPQDTLRAGMSFAMTLRFEGDRYPSVDPLAIQWGAEGSFVWTVSDGRAQRVPVRIMQRSAGAVLVRADLAEGDLIIREGLTNLRPGAEVQVQNLPQGAGVPVAQTEG